MGNNLPPSWIKIYLGDTGICVTGNTPPTKDVNNYGGSIPFIKPPQLNHAIISSGEETLSSKGAKLSRLLPENSVLVSCIGNLGRTALNKVPVTFNQQINAIIPIDAVFSRFLFYQAQSIEFRSQLEEKATATTISIVNKGNFEKIYINLAPLNEQKRIVAKIEELFSELDNGIAALKTAREQLKIYRQAVLKHAFEGKLTAQWREDNADKLETPEQLLARIQTERETRYQQQLEAWKQAVKVWEASGKEGKKPSKPNESSKPSMLQGSDVQNLNALPNNWGFFKLGEFVANIEAGKSFKCDEREPRADEIGVAKVSAVTWGEYNQSESKTCLDSSKVNPDYFIRHGDFILSRANTIDLVGACVIAKNVTKNIMLSDKTLRIRFQNINDFFVLNYLRSRYGRNEIMARSTGNQDSMRNIGQDRIKNIVIPVCSPDEMQEVVYSLESKLEAISLTQKEIDIQLTKAETLRQSILKKAFSGQLVAQDANDEPASELLARIKRKKDKESR